MILFSANCSLLFAQEDDFNSEDFSDYGQDKTGITVEATPETTQQMRIITKEEIDKRNSMDLASLLEESLDMSITRYGGYGNQTELNLRGFDTERIAILIDGVPANSPRSGEFDINQVDLNNVERIEVIYGGSDTKYNVSGALGGVINIITIKKQQPGLTLGGAVSNTGYAPGEYNARHTGSPAKTEGAHYEDLFDMQMLSLFALYGGEKVSWKASWFGNYAGNHYLYQDDYGFARRKESNEILDTGVDVSFVFDLPNYATLSTGTIFYYAAKNYPVTPNAAGFATAVDFSIKENIAFNAPTIFRDDISTEASISYSFANSKYGADGNSDDNFLTALNRWAWYPNEKLIVRTGIDWRFIHIDSTTETEIRTGGAGGLFVTGEYFIFKNLLLLASVKGVTDTKQAVVVPKAGLSWYVSEKITIKNNYFRSFKFPDFDDLYYRSPDNMFVGNPKLKPEDGAGADIAGELTLKNFALNTTAYGQYTTDSIHWVKSAGGRWSPENIGAAFFAGADIRPLYTINLKDILKKDFFIEQIKTSASYTYQLSWLLNEGLSFAGSYRIPYMPNHIIGGSLDVSWNTPTGAGSFLFSAHYESARYADTTNKMMLAPYCILNATVNQNIGARITAFASLRNITNAHYESFAGYYMPGITLTMGLRAKFKAKPKTGEPVTRKDIK
jgi:outer membrane cobalamin receptor